MTLATFTPLLAAGEGFVIVVFIIVAAMGILTTIQRKQEQERQRRVREMIQRGQLPAPAGRQPPQAHRAPARQPPPVRQAPARQAPAPMNQRINVPVPPQRRRQAQPPPPPPRPMPVAERRPVAPGRAPAQTVQSRAATAPTPAVTAGNLHRWLRPHTLRDQFMLTEILRPPLTLRDPAER